MTPKLRFPGFTDEWQTHKLKDLIDLIVDNRGKTPPVITKGIPLIETNSLGRRRVNYGAVKKYVTEKTFNSWFRKHLKENDVLFSTVGQTGIMALYDDSTKAGIAQNIIGLRANEQTSGDFLYYLLSERRNNNKFKQIEMIAVQPSVKVSQMIHLKFRIPTISEQKKIADFLTAVDKRIEIIDKKVELLKQYKKGVMQKIFSQQIRFKDDSRNDYPEWEEKTLGEIIDYEQPTRYIVRSTEYDKSFYTPVLTAGKSFILGYINETDNVYDDVPVIIFDDFTTDSRLVDFSFKVKSSAIKILRARPGVNIRVAYELLCRIRYKAKDHKRHWIGEFQHFTVSLPCEDEQKEIADFLSSIDAKIQAEEAKLAVAKKFKRSLLQRMFV